MRQKPTPSDPYPAPAWLVPHKHPELFRRQALGVRFRWPGALAWVLLLATMALGFWIGWAWLPVIPAGLMIFASGVMTNPGKPLRGAVLALGTLVVFNVVMVALLIGGVLVGRALGT